MKRVRDVMTTEVVVVGDRTPFKEIVGLMRQHDVSALPVVDATDELVGIVSEADLLMKEELVAEGGSHRRFQSRQRRIDRAKASGVVAQELMSSPVETIDPEAPLARAARLLHDRRVKRLPVVDANGKVVGIVSRADLLKVFLRPDREIRDEIEDTLAKVAFEPGPVRVTVVDGAATLQGQVELRSQIPVIVGIARAVDGVVDVAPRLSHEVDDVTPSLELLTPWGPYTPTGPPHRE
ncbi:MAG TPA: CBS domain-containing protein [Actinomycetota bacterium]